MVKTVVNMIIVGIKNMITDRLLCLLIVQMKKKTYIIRTCSHNFPFTYKRNLMSFIVHYQTWLEMHWKHVTAHLCWYRNTPEEVGQLSRDIFRPMILRYFLSASKRPVD